MKKLSVLLSVLLLAGSLAACNSGTTETTEGIGKETDEMNIEITTAGADIESNPAIESDSSDASSNTTNADIDTHQTESRCDTEELDTEPLEEAALPDKEADLFYVWNGSTEFSQYNDMTLEDYYAACAYFVNDGCKKYSSNCVENAYSATYIRDSSYYSLFYNGAKGELTIGYDPANAVLFPENTDSGKEAYDTTVTMQDTGAINGMSFIIRLSDGSFIMVDGGLGSQADYTYKKLAMMNGSKNDIRIRAWILTHSHTDHYGMFRRFASTYGKKVTLERVLYCPVPEEYSKTRDAEMYFLNELPSDVAKFDGAELCAVYTGMTFKLAGLKLEILMSNEQLYKHGDTGYFNDSSTIFRISDGKGSMIFLGDMGAGGCDWLMETYGRGLMSDMVQTSHHGVETAPMSIYETIFPSTVFWPCREELFFTLRGEVHQPLLCAGYVGEHLLHGYGSVTRPLSYLPNTDCLDLMPKDASVVNAGKDVENVRLEKGVLKYDVLDVRDPKISFNIPGLDTQKYNALRIVVGADNCGKASQLFVSTGTSDTVSFSEEMSKSLQPQGYSVDGKTMTLLVFLGNLEGYADKLNALRIDLGEYVGQTVEIYSIEAYWVDTDQY